MKPFVVHGPFAIPTEKPKGGGRSLDVAKFWTPPSDAAYLANECGCYVFAIKNKSLTPIYVGKARNTFKQETFNASNKVKYRNGLDDYKKGKPVMYFVVHPAQKGKTNEKQIGLIEDFLIGAGVAKNPNLQNIKGTQTPKWSIKGVVRSKVKPTKAASDFARLFDIHRS
jgi:hypothetical protein